jgi:hypothetical protein
MVVVAAAVTAAVAAATSAVRNDFGIFGSIPSAVSRFMANSNLVQLLYRNIFGLRAAQKSCPRFGRMPERVREVWLVGNKTPAFSQRYP